MAVLLADFMHIYANTAGAILELERKYKYRRDSGRFDPAAALADMHGHIGRLASLMSKEKYNGLARLIEPLWNSERHLFKSNERWAEVVLEKSHIKEFMGGLKLKVGVDAVKGWPNKRRWNKDAKERCVS